MKRLNFYHVYCIIATCVIIYMYLHPIQKVVVQNVSTHEYQLDIIDDTLELYDGDRHVGTVKWDTGAPLDSLIIDDNL